MRQAEDPLSNRHIGEDTIDEMRRPLGHPPAATPRAEPTALASEAHEARSRTCGPLAALLVLGEHRHFVGARRLSSSNQFRKGTIASRLGKRSCSPGIA
jgi:hypothetical protein